MKDSLHIWSLGVLGQRVWVLLFLSGSGLSWSFFCKSNSMIMGQSECSRKNWNAQGSVTWCTEHAVAMCKVCEISIVFSYCIPHYSRGITISRDAVEASGRRIADVVCCIMNFYWKNPATVVFCGFWTKIWLGWIGEKVASCSFFP